MFHLPLAKGGGRRFKCLTDQYLPPYLFSGIFSQQQNPIEVHNEQQIEEKEWPTGIIALFLFLAVNGVGMGGLQTSHFFPWKSKHFGIQSSGFTLEAISQVGPTLVWERTRCFCSLWVFFFSVYCTFLGVTWLTPGWNLTGILVFFLFFVFLCIYFISHTQRNQRPRGEIRGQVDKLTFLYLLSCKRKISYPKSFTLHSKKHPTHRKMYLYMMKKAIYLWIYMYLFYRFASSGKPINLSFAFQVGFYLI